MTTTMNQEQTNQTLTINCMNGNNHIVYYDNNTTIGDIKTEISKKTNTNIFKLSIFQQDNEEEQQDHYNADKDGIYFLMINNTFDFDLLIKIEEQILEMKKDLFDTYLNNKGHYIDDFTHTYRTHFINNVDDEDELEECDDINRICELIDYPRMIRNYLSDAYYTYDELITDDMKQYLNEEELDELQNIADNEIYDAFYTYANAY